MTQPALFDVDDRKPWQQVRPQPDGETYDFARDEKRLAGQAMRVWEHMSDGGWHTLAEIARACGGSEAAVSARLRDFRKPKFGAHEIERRYVSKGLWAYRLTGKERG